MSALCVFVFFSFVSGLRKLGNVSGSLPETGLMIFGSEKSLPLYSVDIVKVFGMKVVKPG